MPTPEEEQQMFDGLNARIARAHEGFAKLTSYRDDGGAYGPVPGWEITGALGAIADVLVMAGIITDKQLAILVATKQVAILEQSLAEAREHLRQQTGIIAPVGPAGRPQG